MKQWIALLFCAVLLLTMACPVWAEETTTEWLTATTTTEPAVETTTEPSVETTTEPSVENTTVPPTRYAVFLTIAYENKEIVIRAKDANGQPVRNAPVKVAADSEQFTGYTNDAGVAKFPMAEEPAQIICSTEAFKGTILYYEAASASVILHEPSAATTTEPTTTPTTEKPKTTYRTGTSVTWTTSDPLEGNVTVTEIITSSSTVDEEEEEIDEQPQQTKSALPDGWALALMIMGAMLLVVAAVVLCLFLFRAPRMPVEEKEQEKPAVEATPAPVEEPAVETVEAEDVTAEPAEEPETSSGAISLEDLFRDR